MFARALLRNTIMGNLAARLSSLHAVHHAPTSRREGALFTTELWRAVTKRLL
jgi:hypothetical protein